jgi:hypothetical protein
MESYPSAEEQAMAYNMQSLASGSQAPPSNANDVYESIR